MPYCKSIIYYCISYFICFTFVVRIFLSAKLTNKINGLFRRLKRFGYTTCNITVSDLLDTSGRDLVSKLFHLSILCIICYRQRESIVTCEIVVIPMNSRSIVLTWPG